MYDMGPLMRTLFIAYGAQEENNHRRLCLAQGSAQDKWSS